MHRLLLTFTLVTLTVASSFAGDSWHTFTNKQGVTFEGRVLEVVTELGEATVVVKKTGRNATLDFRILSNEDVEYLESWTPSSGSSTTTPSGADDSSSDLGEASRRLYPHTKKEIKATISEIMKRKPPSGIEDDQQDAVNSLNVYRYLCGVLPNAVAEKKKVVEADQAAAACKAHGGLSHSIGSFTNKCNLHRGQNSKTSSVRGFIADGGANNREKRGHRRWCLNPKMVKTGFGQASGYIAMWALDNSGPSNKANWSYPGAGYFPQDYLHGSGWSFFSTSKVPSTEKLKVEVFQLKRRPERKFSITAEIPGRPVKVGFVHAYANVVNFEPDREEVGKGGIFWVKIHGGGLREGYLVELY